MVDSMAIERMVAELYKQQGYFTETRYLYKGKKDLDVLCYKEQKLLLISIKRVGQHKHFEKIDSLERYLKSTLPETVKPLLDNDLENAIKERFKNYDIKEIEGIVYYNYDPKYQPKSEWVEKGWVEVEIRGMHDLINELFNEVINVVSKNSGSRYSNSGLELIRNMVALLRYDPDFITHLSDQARNKIPVIQDGRIK